MCVLSWSGRGEPQPPADVEDDADGREHEQREDERGDEEPAAEPHAVTAGDDGAVATYTGR